MIRKLLISLLALVMCFTACFALASCSDDPVVGPQGDKGDKGDQGEKGPAGEQGPVGPAGEQGIGVKSVEIVDGKLVFTYTDDTKSAPIEFPTIKGDNGENGADGVGIKSVSLSTEGKLVITFTNDETTEIAIPVKNGENGNDGRGIAKIESVAGKLVITYTDNTTEEIEVPAIVCEHAKGRELVEVEKHTLTEKGTYIYVCNDCGHSEVVYDIIHTFTTGKTLEAECEKNAYTADVCDVCAFKTNIVEVPNTAKGHAWVTDTVVVEDGATLCEDGGQTVDYCTACFKVESHVVDAQGHNVAEWTKVDSTKTVKGSISGLCATCGHTVSYELPELNKEDYAYAEEVVIKSCASREGTATYTIYINNKGDLVAVETEGYTAYVTNVTLVPGKHTLNKVEMDDTLVYDPDVTAGITEFTDNKATCTVLGAGYYTCEDCGELVKVTTTKAHTYDAKDVVVTEGKEPTCEGKGEGTVVCTTCKQTVTVEVAALGHKYVYTVKKNVVTNEDGTTKDEYKLYITCEVCSFIDVKDIEGEPVRVEPTCTEAGSITYTYKDVNGELKEQVEVLAKTAHKLNGIFMDKESYPWDYAGITEFTDNKATCTKNGAATYNCDTCKDLILVVTTKDHAWDETKLTIVEPACTEPGYKEGPCATCPVEDGATAKIVREEIKALGHDYKYEVVNGAAEGTYDLVITCGRDDCTYTETIKNVTDITDVAAATCVSEGIKQVTYVDADGKEVKVKFNVPKLQHHFVVDGEKLYIDPDKAYSKNYEAITEFVDHASSCKEKTNGQGYFVCAYCNDMQLVKTQYEHDIKYTVTAPSCTGVGTKVGTCTVCETEITEETDALGHDFKAYVVEVPTYTTKGTWKIACSRCDVSMSGNTMPTLDSDAYTKEVVEGKEPTCYSEGSMMVTWTNNIPINGVKYDFEFYVVLELTDHAEYEEGQQIYTWIETVNELVGVNETEEKIYLFEAYVCKACGKMIVESKKAVEVNCEIPDGTENVAEVILSEDEELKKLIEEGYASINVKLVGIYVWEEEVVEGEGEEATTKVLEYTVVEFELTTTSEAFYVVLVEEVEVEDEVVEGETGDATVA